MKIKNILPIFIGGLIMFTSCTKKQTNPLIYTKNQLIFGSGGGFVNQVNEYRLLDNKCLYSKKDSDSTFVALGKQKSKTVKNLFEESETLFEEQTGINEPGNRYYYLRLQKDSQTQSLVWGRQNTSVPEKAKELHKRLMNLLSLNQ